jgi:hypothetical protein
VKFFSIVAAKHSVHANAVHIVTAYYHSIVLESLVSCFSSIR